MSRDTLLNDLTRWQATSTGKLAKLKPDQLFAQPFLDRYQRLHRDLWHRIIRVHGTISTLETMQSFPFDFLYRPNDMEFWRLVKHNFLEMAAVLLHGLINDQGEHKHTLLSFKNDILRADWIDEALRCSYRETLQDCKLDEAIRDIAGRIGTLRNSIIAHRLIDRRTGDFTSSHKPVNLAELRLLFDATHAMFGALCFGGAFATLSGDLMPGTVGGKLMPTCLETVLNAVLRDSDFVNEPERRGQYWPGLREYLDDERVRVMNECRRRIGLSEA